MGGGGRGKVMGVVRREGVVEVEDLDSGKELKAALAEGCSRG